MHLPLHCLGASRTPGRGNPGNCVPCSGAKGWRIRRTSLLQALSKTAPAPSQHHEWHRFLAFCCPVLGGSATRTGFQGRCFGYNRFRLWFHTNFKESHFKHRIGTNSFLKLAKVYSLIIHSNHYFVSDVGNPQVRAGFLHLPSTVHCTEPSVMQIILEYKTALCERTLQLKSGFLPRFALKNHF